MKIFNIISLLLLTSTGYSQQNFHELPQNFQQKKYGLVVRQGASLIESAFKNILLQSYSYLPYRNKITQSNQTYSLDIQNRHINFNTQIEYIFTYAPNIKLKLSLVYSFEEVSYYEAYIENGDIASISKEMPVQNLNSPLNGSFLWHKKHSTAYYVHKFPPTKSKSPVKDNIVPGLLLKIQFSKNTSYSSNIATIMTKIIQDTRWTELQKLYIIE